MAFIHQITFVIVTSAIVNAGNIPTLHSYSAAPPSISYSTQLLSYDSTPPVAAYKTLQPSTAAVQISNPSLYYSNSASPLVSSSTSYYSRLVAPPSPSVRLAPAAYPTIRSNIAIPQQLFYAHPQQPAPLFRANAPTLAVTPLIQAPIPVTKLVKSAAPSQATRLQIQTAPAVSITIGVTATPPQLQQTDNGANELSPIRIDTSRPEQFESSSNDNNNFDDSDTVEINARRISASTLSSSSRSVATTERPQPPQLARSSLSEESNNNVQSAPAASRQSQAAPQTYSAINVVGSQQEYTQQLAPLSYLAVPSSSSLVIPQPQQIQYVTKGAVPVQTYTTQPFLRYSNYQQLNPNEVYQQSFPPQSINVNYLFRQGDTGKCWYAVMAGTLEVRIIQPETDTKIPVTLCTLGVGATFGESILQDLPRDTTVVTQTTCELLRVEQHDFKLIWEKNKELMNDLVANCKLKNGFGSGVVIIGGKGGMQQPISPPPRSSMSPDQPNPAEAITDSPSTTIGRIGWALRILLLSQNTCLKDRKVSGRLVRRCAPGTELVDWLLSLSPSIHTRAQAAGMWQALLEEGVISHVNREQPFKDKCFLYRFWQDEETNTATTLPPLEDIATAEEQIQESLGILIHRGPDAVLRMILRKQCHERTSDDLETIYEELLHIRALSHLSNSVKRELSSVIVFEAHPRAGTVLFHQGDEGRSWYIIVRGSVDVVIHGKGTVNTLHESDDFGKLALINDAPRAATIVLRENNCHFLRVDKENFNRILRDVEANTVRLKEHGKDVLILEKITTSNKQQLFSSHFKYTVMAGTPQKMLEHLLETRLDGRGTMGGGGDNFITTSAHDPFLDDFLLTHIVFFPIHQLVSELDRYYRIDSSNQDREFILACKRRVIQFVYRWVTTIRQSVFEDEMAVEFLDELALELESDCIHWDALQEEASLMHHVMSQFRRYQEDKRAHEGQKWKLPPCGQPISLFSGNDITRTIIMPQDDIIFRVYCADHTYCTLRMPVDTPADAIKIVAAEKLKMRTTDDLLLVEVKSNGERMTFKDNDISIPTALSINGRIFVSPKDHLDALTCLSEQEGATQGIDADIELFSTKELAYYMTLFDWDLFWCVHEYELLYHTFGRHHFGQITANLDVFLRRFNEIQFWVATEICMTSSLGKRVAILRKFIKLAAYCKEYQNLNAFCAIVMGLSNVAVSRLSQTWDKLPSKFRKLYTEFESLIDPSRNHRAYRVSVGKLQPPVVPFMPLLLKDMTFTHEGNKTSLDGLVNFEKMHMLAQTMRTIRFCRSRHLVLEPPSPKGESEVKSYISCLRVIDNQRVLTNISQKLEPRRS